MKKVILMITIICFCSTAFASTKNCAPALEWWVRNQGKIDGAKISTQQIKGTDQYEITKWEVNGIVKPTDEQVNQIIQDYELQYVPVKPIEERVADLETRVKKLETP